MSNQQKRKADESITNDTKQSTTGVDDAKKPKIEENVKIVLHPLPPTPTGEWANQGWEIDAIIEDPQEIASYKQANNIDASLQIDMIIPGSYVKYGDPIGGDCGMDVTNGPVRCYPCRCSTQSFTNQHGTSSIRKEAWIDNAMNLVVEQKEWANESFYNAVKDMTRSDFEDEFDANFANIPSYCWSNGVWHTDEIIIECGAIIPCKHCGRQVLALGLKEHEICGSFKEEIIVVPFRDYVVAMFEHRTDWIAEGGCDGPFNYYCWANRIGSEGFDGSTDFLKNAIANDSFKNIDEMIKKKKEKRRIQNEKYQREREEREERAREERKKTQEDSSSSGEDSSSSEEDSSSSAATSTEARLVENANTGQDWRRLASGAATATEARLVENALLSEAYSKAGNEVANN